VFRQAIDLERFLEHLRGERLAGAAARTYPKRAPDLGQRRCACLHSIVDLLLRYSIAYTDVHDTASKGRSWGMLNHNENECQLQYARPGNARRGCRRGKRQRRRGHSGCRLGRISEGLPSNNCLAADLA